LSYWLSHRLLARVATASGISASVDWTSGDLSTLLSSVRVEARVEQMRVRAVKDGRGRSSLAVKVGRESISSRLAGSKERMLRR
jgi:hypothetical protein